MAYRIRYSDYSTSSGPPDPARWTGPPGPPGPVGPPGPLGGTGDFLPLEGGIVSGQTFIECPSVVAGQQAGLHVTFNNTNVPGNTPSNGGSITGPVTVVCSDYAGAINSIWGVAVSFDSYSTQFPVYGWPQHVGGSFALRKHGTSWGAGIHITAIEDNNNPSSRNNALLGLEIGHHANGDDDGGNPGSPGVRFGIHLTHAPTVPVTGGGAPAVFAMGYNHDGAANAVTKSLFGVTGSFTWQVFDARTATAPSGYTDPVAAVRMDPGQIVDFNGAPTTLNTPGWTGPAGSYLQFLRASPNRFRWVSGGNELMSISDLGALMITPPAPGPTLVIDAENFISFSNNENRNLKYTQIGAAGNRFSYISAGVELFSIFDTGRLALGVLPTNAANDAAAAAAGVPVGGVYRNGSVLMIRVT